MPEYIHLKIKRQDGVSALMYLREHPINASGARVEPVVWDSNCMEEVCGACTMLVNGVPRQACAALIDELEQPITLEPLTKFPLIRDLMVDRSRMFAALQTVKAWVPLDGSYDIHRHAPLISPGEQAINYIFSRCMTCGCCMEVCPQFHQNSRFIGPAPLGQVRMHNEHPTSGYIKEERLRVLMQPGGIADCGNAQNCVKVCPKDIPLTDAIGQLGRQTTMQWLRDLFVR
jgi:succinate dehydrogenase / fumarate reductase iron-sulfur subunit